jgi:hypothetical protein
MKKCLQDPTYKANNTHPEVNKSNIDRNFGKIRGVVEYNMVQGTTQPYDSCIILVQVEPVARL